MVCIIIKTKQTNENFGISGLNKNKNIGAIIKTNDSIIIEKEKTKAINNFNNIIKNIPDSNKYFKAINDFYKFLKNKKDNYEKQHEEFLKNLKEKINNFYSIYVELANYFDNKEILNNEKDYYINLEENTKQFLQKIRDNYPNFSNSIKIENLFDNIQEYLDLSNELIEIKNSYKNKKIDINKYRTKILTIQKNINIIDNDMYVYYKIRLNDIKKFFFVYKNENNKYYENATKKKYNSIIFNLKNEAQLINEIIDSDVKIIFSGIIVLCKTFLFLLNNLKNQKKINFDQKYIKQAYDYFNTTKFILDILKDLLYEEIINNQKTVFLNKNIKNPENKINNLDLIKKEINEMVSLFNKSDIEIDFYLNNKNNFLINLFNEYKYFLITKKLKK